MSVVEPVERPAAATAPPAGGGGKGVGEVRTGGWFVRITIAVIVILWLIPTVGVLVTSLRPEPLVESSGWWTALAHPFRTSEWTLENYRQALDAGLVDELTIIVAPVILGGGKRLFEGFTKDVELEHLGVRQSPYATFLEYRVRS